MRYLEKARGTAGPEAGLMEQSNTLVAHLEERQIPILEAEGSNPSGGAT